MRLTSKEQLYIKLQCQKVYGSRVTSVKWTFEQNRSNRQDYKREEKRGNSQLVGFIFYENSLTKYEYLPSMLYLIF